jgi:hypothetical protein
MLGRLTLTMVSNPWQETDVIISRCPSESDHLSRPHQRF